MNDERRGKFITYKYYVIMCALCDQDASYFGPFGRWALIDFRSKGWRKRKAGWVCPFCAKKNI